jgi:hypothetical protein
MTTLETAIKNYLDKLPNCWFIKTKGSRRYGRWGIPDFLVCYNGLFYAFEAKTYDDEPEKLQLLEREKLQKARAVAAVVRSVKDVETILNAERRTIINE